MRLFLDTNVVLSAILFPEGRTAAFFRRAITDHTILLSDYVVDELRTVFTRKFPAKVDVLEKFGASDFRVERMHKTAEFGILSACKTTNCTNGYSG